MNNNNRNPLSFKSGMSSNLWLFLILLVSVFLRVVAAVLLGNNVVDLPGTSDQVSYHALALRVLGGHGFSFGQDWWPATRADSPTAHWSFLYTYYLIGIYGVFGPNPLIARIIQATIVGILHPFFVYRIARYIFGTNVGIVSAALTSSYMYFIYYSACLMTEPFYITAILCVLYISMAITLPKRDNIDKQPINVKWKLVVLLGICMGIAVLLRQLFLLFIPFLTLWFFWVRHWQWRKVLLELLPAGLIVAVMILPFTVYNYARFNRFVLLNTNSGYAFFWGNHPIYGSEFISILPPDNGGYQALIPSELRNLDEAALDQALLNRGIRFVLEDPGRIALLSISKIPALFMFWPTTDSGWISNICRVASFGVCWPFMLFGLIIALKKYYSISVQRYSIGLLIIFGSMYVLVHLLSWALVRYRLPVDAVMVIFAGLCLVKLAEIVQSHLPKLRFPQIPL